MVNCKKLVKRQRKFGAQELCHYCRTQVCEECYIQATNKSSMEHLHRQHACVSCVRLHPEAKTLQSPPHRRQQNCLRSDSIPISGGPRINSLSNLASGCNEWSSTSKPRTGIMSVDNQSLQRSTAKGARMPRHPEPPTADRRRRRQTSAIAPTLRSADFVKPSPKPSRARQALRANEIEPQAAQKPSNATELHALIRNVPTSYSCSFTRMSPLMAIRDTTSTGLKQHVDVPKSYTCDFTGTKPVENADEQNKLRLLTLQQRRAKHKVNVPTPTKQRGRAAAADLTNGVIDVVPFTHHATTDAKLASVRRHNAPHQPTKKHFDQPETTKIVSSAGNNRFLKSKKTSAQLIDFHLSAVGLHPRPRRHTTAEALIRHTKTSIHGNLKPIAEEAEHDKCARFRTKTMTEPIDFHLSRFNLPSRRCMAEAQAASDNVRVGRLDSHRKEKKVNAIVATSKKKVSMCSKNKLCDLAYLEKFRSFTL